MNIPKVLPLYSPLHFLVSDQRVFCPPDISMVDEIFENPLTKKGNGKNNVEMTLFTKRGNGKITAKITLYKVEVFQVGKVNR